MFSETFLLACRCTNKSISKSFSDQRWKYPNFYWHLLRFYLDLERFIKIRHNIQGIPQDSRRFKGFYKIWEDSIKIQRFQRFNRDSKICQDSKRFESLAKLDSGCGGPLDSKKASPRWLAQPTCTWFTVAISRYITCIMLYTISLFTYTQIHRADIHLLSYSLTLQNTIWR